jgi:hypothetical protein
MSSSEDSIIIRLNDNQEIKHATLDTSASRWSVLSSARDAIDTDWIGRDCAASW